MWGNTSRINAETVINQKNHFVLQKIRLFCPMLGVEVLVFTIFLFCAVAGLNIIQILLIGLDDLVTPNVFMFCILRIYNLL